MDWKQILLNAGLPCINAWVNENNKVEAEFSRPLSAIEWQTFLNLTDPVEARRNSAKADAKIASIFKTLTPQQAVDYIDVNVVDLASAKSVIKLIVRILIAMRNQLWPDLPDN